MTVLPPLRSALAKYLDTLRGPWLIPNSPGRRWRGDSFGKQLRKLNRRHGLKWSSLSYRHTYATQRAAEGWTLFKIAKEMGNSVAMIEQYYTGYMRPDGAAEARSCGASGADGVGRAISAAGDAVCGGSWRLT